MTREEIEKNRQYQLTGAASDYCRKELPHYDGEALGEITDAFEAGAEWEHKRLVDKACKWLEKHINDDKYYSCIGEETLIPYFLDDFRKAVEEQLMKEQDVDVGIWIKFALFIIVLSCMTMCSNAILISEDVRTIKEHIIKTE